MSSVEPNTLRRPYDSSDRGPENKCTEVEPGLIQKFNHDWTIVRYPYVIKMFYKPLGEKKGISILFSRFNTTYPGFTSFGGEYETALANGDDLFYKCDWGYNDHLKFETVQELYNEIERVGRLYASDS
jgi:hypothetical protein